MITRARAVELRALENKRIDTIVLSIWAVAALAFGVAMASQPQRDDQAFTITVLIMYLAVVAGMLIYRNSHKDETPARSTDRAFTTANVSWLALLTAQYFDRWWVWILGGIAGAITLGAAAVIRWRGPDNRPATQSQGVSATAGAQQVGTGPIEADHRPASARPPVGSQHRRTASRKVQRKPRS